MEPHTAPFNVNDEISPGQLLLHSECGVLRFEAMKTSSQGLAMQVRFAGGTIGLFAGRDLERIQLIKTDPTSDQPLLDEPGRRPKEWKRFLEGYRAGTLFHHHLVPIDSKQNIEAGQLLLHRKHGVVEFKASIDREGILFFSVEFANGWRQELDMENLAELQVIHLDDSSGMRPNLDQYPSKNVEWERFLSRERGRQKISSLTNGTSTIVRLGIRESVRHEVWRRDGGKCVLCGSRVKLEFDHIVPVSKGGSDTVRNIELLCESCNRKKGARI